MPQALLFGRMATKTDPALSYLIQCMRVFHSFSRSVMRFLNLLMRNVTKITRQCCCCDNDCRKSTITAAEAKIDGYAVSFVR